MKSYIETKEQNIVKSLNSNFPMLSFSVVNKLFRKKDIKVNGKRVGQNIKVFPGDNIEVYFNFDLLTQKFDIVYEDDNLAIINKPAGIEVCGSEDSLEQKLGQGFVAVHRIDINTEGLVVFAKNGEAESLLLDAFVKKYIQKKYYAWVFGNLYGNNLVHKGYLFKDSKKARVYIYDIKKPNTKETVTVINKVQGYNRTSLLEVEIPTGRTHQIRAVLSYLNMPIIGDEKYGNTTVNKSQKLKRQCLTAAKLSFAFPKENKLSYLNDMYFEIKPTWLDKIDKKL